MDTTEVSLWLHQQQAVDQTLAAFDRGQRRVLLTMPTGAGKSRTACVIIDKVLARHWKVALYTNKVNLVEQLSRVLTAHGIDHGMRAAGHSNGDDHFFPVQVCSVQTEASRTFKRQKWELHDADLAVVDEAHLLKEKTAKQIMDAHHKAGAYILGLTATPLGLFGLYDVLVRAGTMAELRACGALVPAIHYGPDEPDLRVLKKKPTVGVDLSEKEQRSVMMTPTLFGRVSKWYFHLNPEHKATLLFAPDVEASVWFAEQFSYPEKRSGMSRALPAVRAAHIDGEDVWLDGSFYKSDKGARLDLEEQSKAGTIKVVSNRYVMREGVDWPWIEHIIDACVFGSTQSYLQANGRGLRACPEIGKKHLIVQDHGGNYWRCGSLNVDREWHLEYTAPIYAALREDAIRNKKCVRCHAQLRPGNPWCPECSYCNEAEPFRCKQCGMILAVGKCPGCGWVVCGKRSRPVVTTDGQLVEHTGDIYRPRSISKRPDGPKLWERMIFRAMTPRWNATFRQAEAYFAQENNWQWPDRNWPLMPRNDMDFFRHVAQIEVERLRGDPELLAKVAAYRKKVLV